MSRIRCESDGMPRKPKADSKSLSLSLHKGSTASTKRFDGDNKSLSLSLQKTPTIREPEPDESDDNASKFTLDHTHVCAIPSIGDLEFRRGSALHTSSVGQHGMVHYPEEGKPGHHTRAKVSDFWHYFRHVWLDYLELLLPQHWTPYNPFVRIWNWFSIACVMITLLVTPVIGAFTSTDGNLWTVAIICDICFIMDIFVHFGVPYERSGILVNSKKAIVFTYLMGRRGVYVGCVDIFTALPLELLCFIPGWANVNIGQVAAELRYTKLLRIYRIPIFFGLHENILGSHTFRLRSAKYLIICLLFTHNAACFWYRAGCIGIHSTESHGVSGEIKDRYCSVPSWASRLEESDHRLHQGAFNSTVYWNQSHGLHTIAPGKFVGSVVNPNDPIQAYTVAVYWAIATTTSTGYGDVASVTIMEVWIASFFMLAGTLLFFGMMVGGLTSIMTNLDKQRAKFVDHLNNVKNVMAGMKISDDLRMLVLGYYEYTWLRNKGVKYERLFDTLPLSFRQEISLQLNHKILDKAAIFSNVGPGFLRMISMYMRHRFYLPGQTIAHAGEVGLEMYYIHRGMVEILGDDDENIVATLKEGRIFGEPMKTAISGLMGLLECSFVGGP